MAYKNREQGASGADRYPYLVIVAFSLGWLVMYSNRTILYPLLPVLGVEFNLSGVETGAIPSAYFIPYVAMQIPAGMLGDRFGLKRVMIIMNIIAGLGVLSIGLFARSYLLLLAFVALHGFGAGAFFPTSYAITMSTVSSRVRGVSSAFITSGSASGLALGLGLGGFLYLATQDWRLAIIAPALPIFLVALCYVPLLKATPVPSCPPGGFQQILRNRNLLAISAAGFCSLYGYWVAVTWGVAFFSSERGMDLGIAGLYTAAIALTSIPAGIGLGRISDRVGRKKLSLVMFPMAAAAILMMVWVQSLVGLVAVMVGYGLFGALAWFPVSVAWMGDHVTESCPEAMGQALGFFNTASMAAAIVAPVISGWIRDLTGSLVGAFYLGALMVLLGTILALVPGELVCHAPTLKGPNVLGDGEEGGLRVK